MANNDFMMQLVAALDVAKSKKQINSDIKQLEKTLNMMRLTATLLRGDSKKVIKEQINQIQAQLAPVKLAAKLDEKATQRAVNNALKNVKFSDININVDGINLKLRKALSSVNSHIPKISIPIDYDVKKQRLQNELTTYLTKNSKIRESSGLLDESDSLKVLFDKINDNKSLTSATEHFRLFKSEVQATGYSGASTTQKLKDMLSKIGQIGSFFGVGAMMVSQFSNSLKTLRGNSTILTEIAKTSEMTARQIQEIGDTSFGIASKYGVKSNGYLEGVREMSRSGYNELSKELGELSVLAQSAGDMTADSANNYLLATDAAYKYKGGIENLTTALDGANYISNRNSATLTDIADGVRVSASYAAEAGVQIDELTAAEATMIATTKRSGSEMGRAFRSILLNLQQVSGEFDGEVIDEESLKKVEDRCHSLGVELETMTAEGAKLRNPMEILEELAQIYNSLPDSSVDKQGIISDIGGKYHANALAALLSNWSSYEKMLGEFSQGTGSSLQEAAKTAESWEGRLNALQNQWDSFVNHVTDQNTIKSGISFLDAAIGGAEKLVDTLGAIPTLLTTITGAYTLLNKDYGITQVVNPQSGKIDVQGNYMGINITALKSQKKHFTEAEQAIIQWNNEVATGMTDINKFGTSVVKNNTQLKDYLSTCTDGSASLAGYRASLKAAGVQTDSLRLKTVLMTSAMSFGLGLAIQAGISLLTKVIDEQVHAQERALEAADAANSRIKSINDTYTSHKKVVEETASAYDILSKGVNKSTNENISLGTEDYEKYLDINNQIAEAFPELITGFDEQGRAILTLGDNSGTTRLELEELLEAEKELANYQIAQNIDKAFEGVAINIKESKKVLEDFNKSVNRSNSSLDNLDEFNNAFNVFDKESTFFNIDATKEGAKEYAAAVQEALREINAYTEDTAIQYGPQDASTGADTSYFFNLYSLDEEQLKNLKLRMSEQMNGLKLYYKDIHKSALTGTKEQQQTLALAWKDFIPSLLSTTQNSAAYGDLSSDVQSVINDMISNLDISQADIINADYSGNVQSFIREQIIQPIYYAKPEVQQAYAQLFGLDPSKYNSFDEYEKQINDLVQQIVGTDEDAQVEFKIKFNLDDLASVEKELKDRSTSITVHTPGLSYSNTITELDKMSDAFSALNSAYANFIDKDKEITFENLSSLSEKFKDVKGIETYIKDLQSAKGNAEATQQAFDSLATVYIHSSGVLEDVNEENKELIATYLQEKGIVNASAIVTKQLTAQKEFAKFSTIDLVNATDEEIAAFLNEADASNAAKTYISQLELAKLAVNDAQINTSSDIDQVIALANAAGSSASALYQLQAAKAAIEGDALVDPSSESYDRFAALEGERVKQQLNSGGFNFDYEPLVAADFKVAPHGGGSGGGSGSKSKEPTVFDFMQNKVDNLDNTIEKLQNQVDTFVSSIDKNNTSDTIIDRMIEKMSTLQQMHDRYMEEAANIGLSQEYVDKIQNGSLDSNAIARISDENLVKQIQEYEKWYKSATDTNDKIVETQKNIDKLNLSKLENIKNQFDNILGAQNDLIDANKQYLDLRESMGDEIYADDYANLIALQGELVNKNAEAYNRLANEMSKMDLEKGSDEWYQYNEELQKYKNNMMSAADAVKGYMNEIVNLEFKGLNDFKSQMDSVSNTISTMSDLIGNVGLTDDNGNLTDLGLTQMALYAQQLANSKQEAAEYAEAMGALKDMLDEGLLTQDEYSKRLQDYTSAQNSAVQSTKEARDAILSLVKDGIQAEIDAKKKLVDETKAALDAERDLHDYQNSISEKQDNISKLERQIAALSNSTNREDMAQRLQLQNQLAEAKKELYELQYDHEVDQKKESLDKEFNDFEENKQKESDELDSNLDAQNAAIEKYLNEVKTKYSTVYGILGQYGDEYSLAAINDLTTPWFESGNAADLCSAAVGDALSNMQYNIDSMDLSRLYEMVEIFESLGIANGSIGSSGGAEYDDISSEGKWQTGQGGKDWFGETFSPDGDYFYAADGIYTINGKQYGFDDDGYMQKEWQTHDGKQYYFDANDGHMVKSQWIPGNDGSQYYLLADGTMAEDMAIKDKDGSYYYVDEDGKWDGKTLTAEQVQKLGYIIGYKNGKKRIEHDQLAWTQESKPELITRPSDGALFTPLQLGDGVINGDLTENLMSIAGDPNRFVNDILSRSTSNYTLPKLAQSESREQKIEVNMNIGGVLDETTYRLMEQNMPNLIKKNMKQIAKGVSKDMQYELLGKF